MFDIACLLIMITYCIAGYKKGLIKLIWNVIIFVLDAIVSVFFFIFLKGRIEPYLGESITTYVVTALLTFSFYYVISYLSAKLFNKFIETINVEHKINNFLGLILGIILGFVMILVLFVLTISIKINHINASNYKEFIDKSPKNELCIKSSKISSNLCCMTLFYLYKNVIGEKTSNHTLKKIPFLNINKIIAPNKH